MNFMKMRTFYKKLPLFIKNSILHTYKKFKPQIWAFKKNSIFGTFRDPCILQLVFHNSTIFCTSGQILNLNPERKNSAKYFLNGSLKVADFRGPAETLDFTDLVMMSFPKAKRFTDHYSVGPGPNAYDTVSLSSEKSVGWWLTWHYAPSVFNI